MMKARPAPSGLKHQKEKRNMDYFAGLDVSVKETSICIVDDAGKIVREARVASETNTIYRFKRVGLEAGPLSQLLYSVLAEAGLPVICVETRHMLLLPARQDLIPRPFLIEAPGKMAEFDFGFALPCRGLLVVPNCARPRQAVATSPSLTYRRFPSANDKCLFNSFLKIGNKLLVA